MSRRAVVGCIKPTRTSGSHAELEKLLPPGVETVVHYLNIQHGTIQEFTDAMAGYQEMVRLVAGSGVDLIHPEGTPPFMLRGFAGERDIVTQWQNAYGIPVFTSAMSQADALRALKVRRFVGVGYDFEDMSIVARYFRDAGFDVIALDRPKGIPWEEINDLSSERVCTLVEELYRDNPGAEAIYIQGSKWKVLDIVQRLEDKLGIPVVHPIAARCWAMQKRLGIEAPRHGLGKLLAELPAFIPQQ